MVNKFSKNLKLSIKSKLVILSFLLLTIPMIILGFLNYQKSATSLNELGKENLKNTVEFTIKMIDTLNEEVEKGTISLENAQEKVKNTILGKKNGDGTRSLDTNLELGENGYMIVYDQKGIAVAHPNREGDSAWNAEDSNGEKFAQKIIEKANNGGGFTYFDWSLPDNKNVIEEKVAYSKLDSNWGWVVNASTYMMDFNKPANNILTSILITIGITLIVGIFIIWAFSNRLSKPIKQVTKQMNLLADGDLTQNQIHITSKDEIGDLAHAMNQMQNKLKDIMKNISHTSRTLTTHSEELTQTANEVSLGSEHVASTMLELTLGSEAQANSASDLSFAMETFVNNVQKANINGESIQHSTNEVLDMTKKGSQLMNSSDEQMSKIQRIVHESVQKVRGLDTQSQEISKLVSVIKGISEQTNLLALNAAIEAARAGEHGKGFAVVADEVKKLAEQVSNSISDITGIVKNIQNETNVVAKSLEAGYKEVEQGTSQIKTTGETFNQISVAVSDMVNNIKTISENLSEIATNSRMMNTSIEEIASVSEESAAGIEQTSASSQQTSGLMEQVAGNSHQLAKLAEELNELVHQFKL